jgi:hemerythrin-like domain-containing protein
MDLKHSEVRRLILDEHGQLRRELREILETLEDLEQDRPGAPQQLYRQWRAFTDRFLEHLEHEDAVLRPVLERIDAWSEVRLERLDEDHLHQRERVDELMRVLSTNPLESADDLRSFLDELAVDMDEEERLDLGEELMRDEVLPYSGGFSG